MSASGEAGHAGGRRSWRWFWIVPLLGMGAPGCGPTAVVDLDPPRVGIEVQLDPSIPVPNQVKVSWAGAWLTGTTDDDGATSGEGTIQLTPAGAAQNGGLVTFPASPALRQGCWELAVATTRNGAPSFSMLCQLEIFAGVVTRVKFTEGLDGCAPLVGGASCS